MLFNGRKTDQGEKAQLRFHPLLSFLCAYKNVHNFFVVIKNT